MAHSCFQSQAPARARSTSPPCPGRPVRRFDNCTSGKCLFSYAAVPVGVAGETLTSWSFYALGNSPVAPVIFNSSGQVIGLGAAVTPSQAGVNSAIFALRSGTNVLTSGDSVGFYYASGGGSIAWANPGAGVTYKSGGRQPRTPRHPGNHLRRQSNLRCQLRRVFRPGVPRASVDRAHAGRDQ